MSLKYICQGNKHLWCTSLRGHRIDKDRKCIYCGQYEIDILFGEPEDHPNREYVNFTIMVYTD